MKREELVERAARAVWGALYPRKDDQPNATSWEDWERYVQENPGKFDGRDKSRRIAQAALTAILEGLKPEIFAVIDTRRNAYERKAEQRDPLADDDRNGYDAAKDHAMAMDYLRGEMDALLSTLDDRSTGGEK